MIHFIKVIFISPFILIMSCKSDVIQTITTRLHTEIFVSSNSGGGDIYYNTVKVFYYDEAGRRTGTGDYSTFWDNYQYIDDDSIYYTSPMDTVAYSLNDQGFPAISIHSTTNGTLTDYIIDTTFYFYEGDQLAVTESHQSIWLNFGYIHKELNTYYTYSDNGDLIADSTYEISSGELVSRTLYTYVAETDEQHFNQVNNYPYKGNMSSHLLLSVDRYDYYTPFYTEMNSTYSYTFDIDGLPEEKYTTTVTFDEASGQTTTTEYHHTYSWVNE